MGALAVIHKRECLIDRTQSDYIIDYLDYLKNEAERRRNNENGDSIDQEIANLNQSKEEHIEHMTAVKNFLDSDQSKNTDDKLSYCLKSPEIIVQELVTEITGKTQTSFF